MVRSCIRIYRNIKYIPIETNLIDDGHDSNITSQSCTLSPQFVDPTLPRRECIVIPPGTHFVQQIVTSTGCSNVTITSIQVSAPNGTRVRELQHVQGTDNYYINVIWIPAADQENKTHMLCSVAVNAAGLSSELFCMELAAGYQPPAPILTSANHQLVYPSNNTLHIMFDRTIQRPSTSAFIRFYKLGEEVYQIDSSLSSEVTFMESSLTIVPNYNFTIGSTYYINFDRGVVENVYPEGCLLVNEPVLSNTFWTLEVVSFESGERYMCIHTYYTYTHTHTHTHTHIHTRTHAHTHTHTHVHTYYQGSVIENRIIYGWKTP